MAFDLSTAANIEEQVTTEDAPEAGIQSEVTGFDLSTAADVVDAPEQSIEQPVEQPTELPVGNAFDAIVEPLTAIASGTAGMVAGGVTEGVPGLAKGVIGMDVSENVEGIESANKTMSEFGEPQTQAGQYGLQKVGDFMEAGIDVANMSLGGLSALSSLALGKSPEEANDLLTRVKEDGYFTVLGDEVLNKTGSPWLATVAKMSPEIVGSLYPVSRVIKHRGAQTIPEQEIAQRIIDGDKSGELAKYVIDGSGKLKFDPVAQQAIDSGLDQGLAMAVKGLPEPEGIGVLAKTEPKPVNPTKKKMLEMINIKRKGQGDQFYADKNRPADVAGKSLADRIQHVIKVNKDAGKAIDTAAKNLKGQSLDFSAPINSFLQSLDSMGIKINPKTFKADFKGSDIEGFKGDETAINRIIERMQSGGRGEMPSAYDVHRLKRYIDNNVSYGKANATGGMTGATETLLKDLRRGIDESLDGQFPEYDAANTAYADTIGVINEIQRLSGKSTDLSGANVGRQLGILTRRMLGNNQSTVNVIDSVNDINNVARQYGGVFDDNLGMLVSFSNQLDKIFGSSASTSFQGIQETAFSNTLGKMADGRSTKQKAADYLKKKLSPAEKDAFDTLQAFIEGNESPWAK